MFSIDNMEVSMKLKLKYCVGIIVLLLVFCIAGLTAMPKSKNRGLFEINQTVPLILGQSIILCKPQIRLQNDNII